MTRRNITDRSGRRWSVRGLPGVGPLGPYAVPRLVYRAHDTGERRVCPAPRMPAALSERELVDRLHVLLTREGGAAGGAA